MALILRGFKFLLVLLVLIFHINLALGRSYDDEEELLYVDIDMEGVGKVKDDLYLCTSVQIPLSGMLFIFCYK